MMSPCKAVTDPVEGATTSPAPSQAMPVLRVTCLQEVPCEGNAEVGGAFELELPCDTRVNELAALLQRQLEAGATDGLPPTDRTWWQIWRPAPKLPVKGPVSDVHLFISPNTSLQKHPGGRLLQPVPQGITLQEAQALAPTDTSSLELYYTVENALGDGEDALCLLCCALCACCAGLCAGSAMGGAGSKPSRPAHSSNSNTHGNVVPPYSSGPPTNYYGQTPHGYGAPAPQQSGYPRPTAGYGAPPISQSGYPRPNPGYGAPPPQQPAYGQPLYYAQPPGSTPPVGQGYYNPQGVNPSSYPAAKPAPAVAPL